MSSLQKKKFSSEFEFREKWLSDSRKCLSVRTCHLGEVRHTSCVRSIVNIASVKAVFCLGA